MEVFKKELAKHVDVLIEGGKLKVTLDLAAVLDEGSVALKAKIPGSVEEPFVDAILKMVKEQLGVDPAKALAAAGADPSQAPGGSQSVDPKKPA